MSNPIPISSAPSHIQPSISSYHNPPTATASGHSRSFSRSFSHSLSPGSPGTTSFSPTNPSPILSSALNIPGPAVGLSLTSSSLSQTRSLLSSGSYPASTSPFFPTASSPPGHQVFLSSPSTPPSPSSSPSSSSPVSPSSFFPTASSARRSFSTTAKPTLGLSVPSGSPPQKDCQWASAWAYGSVAAGIKSPGLYGGSALADEEDDSLLPPVPLGSSLPVRSTAAAAASQKALSHGPGPSSSSVPGPGPGPGSQQTIPAPRRVSIAQPPQESSQRGQNVLRRLSLSSGSLLRPNVPAANVPPSSQPTTTTISYSFPNATPGSAPSVQFMKNPSDQTKQHQPMPDPVVPTVSSIGSRRKSVKSSSGKRAISPTGERMLVGHAGGGMF